MPDHTHGERLNEPPIPIPAIPADDAACQAERDELRRKCFRSGEALVRSEAERGELRQAALALVLAFEVIALDGDYAAVATLYERLDHLKALLGYVPPSPDAHKPVAPVIPVGSEARDKMHVGIVCDECGDSTPYRCRLRGCTAQDIGQERVIPEPECKCSAGPTGRYHGWACPRRGMEPRPEGERVIPATDLHAWVERLKRFEAEFGDGVDDAWREGYVAALKDLARLRDRWMDKYTAKAPSEGEG